MNSLMFDTVLWMFNTAGPPSLGGWGCTMMVAGRGGEHPGFYSLGGVVVIHEGLDGSPDVFFLQQVRDCVDIWSHVPVSVPGPV